MATWSDLTREEPEMADLGAAIFGRFGLAYLATVRADGGPRVHPISPVVIEGRLYAGLKPRSPKRFDLQRDARYMLHSLPGPRDAEFAVTGRAIAVTGAELEGLAAAARDARAVIPTGTAVFELTLERVTCTTYTEQDGGLPVPARRTWRPDAGRGRT